MHHRVIASLAASLTLLTAFSHASHADDSLLIAGTEIGAHRGSFSYLGGVTALPGSSLGNGWIVQAMGYGLTYEYQGAASNIEGDVLGGHVLLGWQDSHADGWWGISTGPSYRNTELSPSDPTSDVNENEYGWLLQGENETMLSPDFKVNLMGNYMFAANDEFWTRGRLLYRLNESSMWLGPEAVYMGDASYNAWQLGGGLFGIEVADRATLGIKGGVRKVENLSAGPYGGVELTYSF